MKKIILIAILSSFFFNDCSNESGDYFGENIDCSKMKNSFLTEDYSYANSIINSICQYLPPSPTSSDPQGHKENTNKLINTLNLSCTDLNFNLDCYACLVSLPPKSNVSVLIDSSGVIVHRAILINVPSDDYMYVNQ